jgi:hypothetical protein
MPTNHDEMTKAREAAEALFRPKPHAEIRPNSGEMRTTDDEQPSRKPRILAAASPMPEQNREPEPLVASRSQTRRATVRNAAHLAASKYGRIRALATYGMTIEQIAEIYGVPVAEIARIVS